MIPAREGSRPTTSNEGPHRQVDQLAPPAEWGELVARAFSLPHVVEHFSTVSPASSRALLFDDLRAIIAPETSLAPDGPIEPVHIHGVFDTSVHLCLPVERATEVCDLGWGEPHQFGDHGTEIMVYGPRTRDEIDVVVGLIEESLAFAREYN